MLRANRMKPSGSASWKNARSSAVRSGPEQPRMTAFNELSRRRDRHAVGLASLERAADALRLLLVERSGLDAIPHALVAEVDANGLHLETGEHVTMRALQ